jgi:hypothetical protein
MNATLTIMPDLVHDAACPLSGADRDYVPLLELIGDAPLVLLGEATQGTHEFHRERAQITKRLILERGSLELWSRRRRQTVGCLEYDSLFFDVQFQAAERTPRKRELALPKHGLVILSQVPSTSLTEEFATHIFAPSNARAFGQPSTAKVLGAYR